MAKKELIEFPFPLKGKDENWRVSSQPPLTTPIADNVRVYDILENRARGSPRPGLGLIFASGLGLSGNYGAGLYGAGTYGGQTAGGSPVTGLIEITLVT